MDLKAMGDRIKERRLKLSMSQSRLAELTGYKDKTAISHIEAGRIDLPQSKLILIADALKTTPAELLDGGGHYEKSETLALAQQLMDNDELHALFRAAKDSDPEDIEAVYNMLLALKRKERH